MNIKKLDEKDIVFLDQPFSVEERQQLSELLRKKKEKILKRKKLRLSQIASTEKGLQAL